jgi:hypothetical protein
MSTVDPIAARRARAARRPALAQVVVALALLVVGGALQGYGWTALFAPTVLLPEAPAEPNVASIVSVVLGLPMTIAATGWWMTLVMRRRELGAFSGFAAFWLGAAGGLWVSAEHTGLGILRTVAICAVAFAVLLAVVGALAARSRDRARARTQEVIRVGRQTTATVSDKGYIAFDESSAILTVVTFTFTDLQGVQRWVQRPVRIAATDPVVDGQETSLWFDPQNPGDDARIAVQLAVESPWR